MMQPFYQDLPAINRLFIAALIALAEAGEAENACRIAAQGWSVLRHNDAREAERLSTALHRLTRNLSIASHDRTGATSG